MIKRKPTFDLFAIVEWTAAIAFLCALIAGSGGRATWTWDFKALPPDDSALRAWLAEQNRQDVEVIRQESSLTLATETGIISGPFHGFKSLPQPPWQELGYPPVGGMRGSTSWTMFSGSPYLWVVGFAVLILLAWIRRTYIKPRQS